MSEKPNKVTQTLRKLAGGRAWLWLLLVTCAAIFLFPFLWMILSSIKSDEEVNKGDFWPSMPEFRTVSPYVVEGDELPPPDGVSKTRWGELMGGFTQYATEIVRGDVDRPCLLKDDAKQDLIVEASYYLVKRGVKKMSSSIWENPDDEAVQAAFEKALQAGGGVKVELEKAYKHTLARLTIRAVKVRSRGIGTVYETSFKKGDKTPLPDCDGSGKLTHDADGELVVRYDFADASSDPVKITHAFHVQRAPDDLFRVIIPMTHDGSWHCIHAELEVNGVKFTGTRPIWSAERKPSALTLQLTGNDEDEWGKRPWVPMQRVTAGESFNILVDPETGEQTSQCKLTLTIDPSSTATARYGKVKRNYERVLFSMPFWKYVSNSIVLTLLSIFGAVLSSCFVAYAFARLRWPGRSVAFLILLSTMMLPPQVTMIPQFLIWRELGWYNTLNPIWLPTWFGIAFFIFLMVQQMKTIPRDLEEAAEIDGMNRLQIWWYVIVPLVKPAMAAIAIMSFMASWNEFMQPLIYLRDMGRFPLSVGIYAMGADDTTSHDMSLILAGNLLMTLPVVVIFFVFQRYFIQGMSSSGVKG